MSARRPLVGLLAFVCFFYSVPAGAEEPTLRVDGIPNRLVLPLEEGENRVLTAIVGGATVKAVWLATGRESRLRLHFKKAGANQFQLNLADPKVYVVLQGTPGARACQVFAETTEGRLLASVPINYTTATRNDKTNERGREPPALYLISTDKDVPPRRIKMHDWITWVVPQWVNPEDVAVIEMRFKSPDQKGKVLAAVGERTWTFTPTARGVARREVTGEFAKAWRAHGDVKLIYVDDVQPQSSLLRARPKELRFKQGNVISMTVYQPETKPIPGANDYLTVKLGDITGGQVLVTVRDAEGGILMERVSLRQRDRREFGFGGQVYVLTVHKMFNKLFGRDWAEVEISRVATSEQDKIEALLRHVAASKVIFLREGKQYQGPEAAEHLRQKYAFAGPRIRTLEEFIDKIASRSSLTGKPYQVRLPDGKTVDAGKWLRAAAESKAAPDMTKHE